MKKRRWTCIDILKCLAAIAVIEIHKPLEIQGGDEFLILCRFAVPVFFYDHRILLSGNSGEETGTEAVWQNLYHYHWRKSVLPAMGNPSGS